MLERTVTADRWRRQAIQEAEALVRKGAGLWVLTAHQRGDFEGLTFRPARRRWWPWLAVGLALAAVAAISILVNT